MISQKLRDYHTPENSNIDMSIQLSEKVGMDCYNTPEGGIEVIVGDEVLPIECKERNRPLNSVFILFMGPLGFLFSGYGVLSFFFSFLLYFFAFVKFGPVALAIVHVLAVTSPFWKGKYKILDKKLLKKINKYKKELIRKRKSERREAENQYYEKYGCSRWRAKLIGDPLAFKGLVKSFKSLIKAIQDKDLGELKNSKEYFMYAIDPVEADKKGAVKVMDEKRTKETSEKDAA